MTYRSQFLSLFLKAIIQQQRKYTSKWVKPVFRCIYDFVINNIKNDGSFKTVFETDARTHQYIVENILTTNDNFTITEFFKLVKLVIKRKASWKIVGK